MVHSMWVAGSKKIQQLGLPSNIMDAKTTITIALEDMIFYAFHGVYAEEQTLGREFRVSVYLECHVIIDGDDRLSNTYNYEWIYEIVKEEMAIPRKLLETVAFHIAQKLRQKSNLLSSGEIRIYKEGLQLGGKIGRSLISFPV